MTQETSTRLLGSFFGAAGHHCGGCGSQPQSKGIKKNYLKLIISRISKKKNKNNKPKAQTTKPCFVVWADAALSGLLES